MDSVGDTLAGGLPHSDISGSKSARNSPELIAACYVLHRLSVPRHPPDALITLNHTSRFRVAFILQQIPSHAGTKPHMRYPSVQPGYGTAEQQVFTCCREDTNCDDHELTRQFRRTSNRLPEKTGEQNPWISQTLRFTHIHNEKQPTDIAFGPRPDGQY